MARMPGLKPGFSTQFQPYLGSAQTNHRNLQNGFVRPNWTPPFGRKTFAQALRESKERINAGQLELPRLFDHPKPSDTDSTSTFYNQYDQDNDEYDDEYNESDESDESEDSDESFPRGYKEGYSHGWPNGLYDSLLGTCQVCERRACNYDAPLTKGFIEGFQSGLIMPFFLISCVVPLVSRPPFPTSLSLHVPTVTVLTTMVMVQFIAYAFYKLASGYFPTTIAADKEDALVFREMCERQEERALQDFDIPRPCSDSRSRKKDKPPSRVEAWLESLREENMKQAVKIHTAARRKARNKGNWAAVAGHVVAGMLSLVPFLLMDSGEVIRDGMVWSWCIHLVASWFFFGVLGGRFDSEDAGGVIRMQADGGVSEEQGVVWCGVSEGCQSMVLFGVPGVLGIVCANVFLWVCDTSPFNQGNY